MMDIKANKLKINKKAEKVVVKEVENTDIVFQKKDYSIFSGVLFVFMTTLAMCYVFMVSSSVFYAVKAAQFTFQAENINNTFSNVSVAGDSLNKGVGDRISYINKDSDTSISLR